MAMKELRRADWSVNLEDAFYEENPDELYKEAVDAVGRTASGCYVNLVTPAGFGHPEEQGFIEKLMARLADAGIPYKEIRFIDECGCGGFVTRVFR
jgi:hypothetical protein